MQDLGPIKWKTACLLLHHSNGSWKLDFSTGAGSLGTMEEAWLLASFPLIASVLLCACAQSSPCRELNVVTREVLNGEWLGKGLLPRTAKLGPGGGWAELYKSVSHLCYHFACLSRLIGSLWRERKKSEDPFQTSLKHYGKLQNPLPLQLYPFPNAVYGICLQISRGGQTCLIPKIPPLPRVKWHFHVWIKKSKRHSSPCMSDGYFSKTGKYITQHFKK